MSVEQPSEGVPFSAEDIDFLNMVKLELLRDERPIHSFGEERPGTNFLAITAEGPLEFTVHPWNEGEEIAAGVEVYAKIINGHKEFEKGERIAIFGASEGGALDPDAIGVIKQYSDFAYSPLSFFPVGEDEAFLDRSEDNERSSRIIYTQEMGLLQVKQERVRVLSSVVSLVRQSPLKGHMTTPIFQSKRV